MNFVILTKEVVDINKFVKFWSGFYFDRQENRYFDAINQTFFKRDSLLALFEWKNGSRLSAYKLKSFENKICSKIEIINYFKNDSNFNIKSFLAEFSNVSVIWKIFLLHIIKPNKYSIFDQHVYRAYYFIENSQVRELVNDEKEKERVYFEEYCDFIENIQSECNLPLKKIDEALWAFGKFLKSNYKKSLY